MDLGDRRVDEDAVVAAADQQFGAVLDAAAEHGRDLYLLADEAAELRAIKLDDAAILPRFGK